jgi:hypothetical protein
MIHPIAILLVVVAAWMALYPRAARRFFRRPLIEDGQRLGSTTDDWGRQDENCAVQIGRAGDVPAVHAMRLTQLQRWVSHRGALLRPAVAGELDRSMADAEATAASRTRQNAFERQDAAATATCRDNLC